MNKLLKSIPRLILLSLFQILLFSGVSFADFDTDPFLDQRVTLDTPPIDAINENIDPYSGNMTIVQTDLHLPGNGGLDLVVMRYYNSFIWSQRGIVNPVNLALKDHSYVGLGWTMHMGILRNCDKDGTQWGGNPVMELPDGTKQIFNYKSANQLISKDYWILNVITTGTTYEAISPQGVVYTFSFSSSLGATPGYLTGDTNNVKVAQVTKVQNPARNANAQINITYQKSVSNYSTIQNITDSVGRLVTFNYDNGAPQKRLLSISTDNRIIHYTYTTKTPDIFVLTSVQPPVGNSWQYDYDTTNAPGVYTYELSDITYPSGGKNRYTYSDIPFPTGDSFSKLLRVVTKKEISGRNIPLGGVWNYSYWSGNIPNKTVINGPNVTETHMFWGWGNTGSTAITNGNVWRVGLPISKDYNFNGATLSETYIWQAGSAVSNSKVNNNTWGYYNGILTEDAGVFPALLTTKSTTRDGKTYTTTNSNFTIPYGDPQTVVESGDVSRTRTLAYCTNTTKNIVKGKPLSESIAGHFAGADTTTATFWQYGVSNDCVNPTVVTKDGVSKTIGYDATTGNLSSITDANNKPTTYQWTNGRISREINLIYAVSRVINPNGTIASETNGRQYTTNYSYDGNLRLTGISPPVGNATSFSYPADSSYRQQTRGGYSITHYFDGFARPTGSFDSKGVTSTIVYNAYGVKDYTDSNVGDKSILDYFGRAKQVVHKDNTSLSYAYSGSNVTITDENNTPETLTYNAFGNPDEKYLMAVRDQATNTTTYTRNIHGSVTGITQGSITRSYTFDTKNFLTSELTPEGGSISYGRDSIGTMTWKTDATGTKNYAYDNLYRLTGITSGTGSISYGYDNAGNRTSMTSPSASISYSYDAVNRMTPKTETVAGRSYTTSYGYDANDNITSQTYPANLTYPSGRTISYGYNPNNQVTSISGFGGSVTSVNYNPAGLPTSFITTNGTTSITDSFTYNTRNLATAITAGSALNLTYGYDSRGNTTSINNQLDSTKNQLLGYDALSRLTGFNGAWGSGSFGYDSLGNRINKAVAGSSTSYAYSSNRLSSTSGGEAASYSYNGVGALSGGSWQGGNYSLAYDPFNNLQTYSSGATTLASFGYDGDGMRVTKAANGKTVVYHYDQSGNAISETDNNGTFIADYILLNGKLVAKIASVPDISITPTSKGFGSVIVGFTPPSTLFTVTNRGTADLVIGTATITGTNATDFGKTSDTCSGHTLAPSATCSITITAVPATAGIKSASLSIPSNDPDTPTLTAALSETGVLPVSLTVVENGTGSGTVTSDLGGISCGQTCSALYAPGTIVTLAASSTPCSSFTGWSGACSGTGACAVTLNADTSISATFDMVPPVADFALTPTTGSAPILVNFSDLSQCASSWLWDFGNGNTSTQQNPAQSYNTTGTYSVSLTVTNPVGMVTTTKSSILSFLTCSTPVRILNGLTYLTLQDAFNAASNDSIIQSAAQDFVENVTNTNPNSFSLSGGYNCDYSSLTGKSILKGTLNINDGALTIEDVEISD